MVSLRKDRGLSVAIEAFSVADGDGISSWFEVYQWDMECLH
jgi:hypothetical protein